MSPERGDSYQARPARIRTGGAPVRAGGVAIALVTLVILALLKPWGNPPTSGAATELRRSSATPVALASMPTAGTSAREAVAGSSGATVAAGSPRTAGDGDPLFGPLVARLSARSGAWGIGSGGWGISPVSGSPWTGWERVEPSALKSGDAHPRLPSCDDLPWFRVGIVVAVTVPPDLPPDWTVTVSRVDGAGLPISVPDVTQVSPPGNRGVTYLVGADSAQWRSGAYRFAIRTSSSAVVMDACLIAL